MWAAGYKVQSEFLELLCDYEQCVNHVIVYYETSVQTSNPPSSYYASYERPPWQTPCCFISIILLFKHITFSTYVEKLLSYNTSQQNPESRKTVANPLD